MAMAEALTGVRVSIVGINYAPEPTGSAPYTAGLAEILAEHGAEVDVLTGVPHYPTWRVEDPYRNRLRFREERNGVRVHRARHFVPRRQTAVARLMWDGTFLANAGLMRPSRKPDVVIASTPSLGGAVVGANLARRFRVPLGLVVQDLVGQAAAQSGISGGGAVAGTAAKVEGRVLRSADLVAVVSPSFRRQLADYGVDDGRVRALPNWTHIADGTSDRATTRARLGWAEDSFVVLHTGNMGLKQDLGNVIDTARLLSDGQDVLIVLMGDGSQREDLERSGRDVGSLRFLDPVPDDSYADVLRAADLLLVNERPTVGEMSLPSKLTSYFAVGQPVLAAVSADGACARELAATDGAARRVDPGQPAALAAAIRTLRNEPAQLAAMGRAAAAYADRALGRSTAAKNVLDFTHALVEQSRRSAGSAR